MIAQTIVYLILSILSATAVYAMGHPIGKSTPEQVLPGEEEKDSQETL
jgi:Na+-transporting methylmalonyl-CoA/oxaloacetate decarboxylase gamma subunit